MVVESGKGKTEVIGTEDLLICVGRKPNLSAISKLDLEMNASFVKVNDMMQASRPNIYAVGDLIGGWQLAHAASAEGLVAAANAAGEQELIKGKIIPRCVYTSPEVASVGISEAEAKERGLGVKVVKTDLSANGKALAMGEAEGFVKLIADVKHGEILGVTMVGACNRNDCRTNSLYALGRNRRRAGFNGACTPNHLRSPLRSRRILAWKRRA